MWTGPGESALKKAKAVPSADKVMATIFWDSHGIILIDYLQKCFSTTTMHQLTRVPLQRPNYLIYYEILPHPPYSPDLAPSDYFLFPNMKTWLGGKRFSSNE